MWDRPVLFGSSHHDIQEHIHAFKSSGIHCCCHYGWFLRGVYTGSCFAYRPVLLLRADGTEKKKVEKEKKPEAAKTKACTKEKPCNDANVNKQTKEKAEKAKTDKVEKVKTDKGEKAKTDKGEKVKVDKDKKEKVEKDKKKPS
jgi:hypothetical protein